MSCLPASRLRELFDGVRLIFPLLLGTIPFAILYGSLAIDAGLTPAQAQGMSLLVFAGAAQFVAVTLLTGGASAAVLLSTTLVINLRHLLYSAALQPHVRHLRSRWRMLLAFWLTDEAFAVAQQRYARVDASPYKHWFFMGAAMAMYLNWQAFTLAGILFGQRVPNLADWGLDFAMLATFIGIVVPMLRNRPSLAAALVAGSVSLACQELPYQLGLLVAALAGIASAVLLERHGGQRLSGEGAQ
ncbi:AzlC family ABC transporter permease [Billgrantia endophytica]|uniref:Branched-chain amino acid ABC transporter permease n=1 Tax=Billgrantia endophytica TaxID=2033802 RepID=A0A2N7U1U4_9GAMM|nr:AzlC family ABC transporter permease [Halomonas endophytica]PMR74390.1 branched-chain amino acid ABC transporter permease [Halomonas endophytica]